MTTEDLIFPLWITAAQTTEVRHMPTGNLPGDTDRRQARRCWRALPVELADW
jgi:hypothetical protein